MCLLAVRHSFKFARRIGEVLCCFQQIEREETGILAWDKKDPPRGQKGGREPWWWEIKWGSEHRGRKVLE